MTAETRRLAAFLLVAFLAGAALLTGPLRARWQDTVLLPVAWFLTGRQASDSWTSMEKGRDYFTGPPRQRSLYEATFFSRRLEHKGFQYPPTSLLAMEAASVFGAERTRAVLSIATWLWIPATAVLVAALDRRMRRTKAAAISPVDLRVRMALAGFAVLTFYPLIRAYANGQVQTWLNGLMAAAILAMACGRTGGAGALVAAMALLKPQAGILLLWALLRRQWRFALGFFAVALPALALSVFRYGLAPHLEYLRVLGFLSRRGESFFPNHSVNGLMHRLLGNGENLDFYRPGSVLWMDHFPPYHPVVHGVTLFTTALLLASALWPPREGRGGIVDFSFAALASTVASPIAWEHHYGVLLPMLIVLYHLLQGDPGRLRTLAAVYVVASHSWWVTRAFAGTPLSVLQSYLLFAALAALALLHSARTRALRPDTRLC